MSWILLMFRFLPCTWVLSCISESVVELWWKGCFALHRPLPSDNLILSSVLVYKKDRVNVVLAREILWLLWTVFGPRLVLQQKGGHSSCAREHCNVRPSDSYTPQRLNMVNILSSMLHKCFWKLPLLLLHGKVSGCVNLTLVFWFSRECTTSHGGVAQCLVWRRKPSACCWGKGRLQELAKV